MLSPLDQIVFAWVLGLVILIGCCAYGIVVWVLSKDKEFRRSSASVFLLNLLTIDLLNLLLVMPFSISSIDGRWKLSQEWQLTISFLGTWFETGSILALGIISLDRFVAVRTPFLYIAVMTKRKAVIIVLITWLQAFGFSLAPVPLKWYSFSVRYVTCTFDVTNTTTSFRGFMTSFVVCNFLLSFLVIVITYIYIFKVANYHRKSIARTIVAVAMLFAQVGGKQMPGTRRTAVKSAMKMSVVIGAFVVCHTPYAVVRILDVLRRDLTSDIPESVTVATKWLSYGKSALDPFIYFIVQHRFRRLLHKFFVALLRKRNRVGVQPPSISSRRTTRITAFGSVEDVSANLSSRRTTLHLKSGACGTLAEGDRIDFSRLPVAVIKNS